MNSANSETLVVLIRHAEYELPYPAGDSMRPLTQHGKRSVQILGNGLVKNLPPIHFEDTLAYTRIIFTSPFLRAATTARLLSTQLNPIAGVHEVDELALQSPNVVNWSLKTIVANLGVESLVFVSHMPELNAIGQRLKTDLKLDLQLCEAACLSISPNALGFWQVGSAQLLWKIKG
ncbi:MAG: histidine phosphatase family protein [Chloroflexi bacterium]|uniref:Histidine phosphatase family protein n=1 Tax=Candidatus Chlorohelix allophototropha TaxID=3003348 RepID=A0A8T7LZR7_9CHLR|nr:histidine phosphatase family protein [Chloroflexota bacterium]WJW65982.1 histidine phosphatase family protein [Chloroflexota bacterium L227-S17]